MYEQKEELKRRITEARTDWLDVHAAGMHPRAVEHARQKVVALVGQLQTLNGRRPANVQAQAPTL